MGCTSNRTRGPRAGARARTGRRPSRSASVVAAWLVATRLVAAPLVAALTVAVLFVVSGASEIAAGEDVQVRDERSPTSEFPAEGLSWRHIGPYRGGRVTAVAGDAANPHRFYFGATGGGVWKTENAGATWTNVSDGSFGGSIGAIAVAPGDANVLYVGTGESPIRGVATSHGRGVYRSTDAGKTWRHVGLDATRHIGAVRVDPRDPDRAFVAAQGSAWGPNPDRGVFRTTDGGASWRKVLFVDDTTGAVDLSMDPNNPRVLYAAMWDHVRLPWQVRSGGPGSGVFKSTDGGDTWTRLTGGLPDVMGKIGVAVSPADPTRVYAVVEAEEGRGGLYRSRDGGKTWALVNGHRSLWGRAWYYMHVFADPRDADTVYVLNSPFLKSIDGGRTFQAVATPHVDNHDLWIHPVHPEWMINGNDGGANVSLDGGKTWSTQANQPTAQIYRVVADESTPYRVYGGQQDNTTVRIASRTFDGGIGEGDWCSVGGGESAWVAFDPVDPRLVYASSIVGMITEWDRDTRALRDIQPSAGVGLGLDARDARWRFNWNPPVLAPRHDPGAILFAGNKLLRTRDRGYTWEEVSPDLTRDRPDRHGPGGVPFTNEAAGGEYYDTILYLAESPHDGTLWAGSDDGLVHRTTADGAWVDVTPPGVGEAMINCIEVSPHDRARAYLAVTGYKLDDLSPAIYRTDDAGASWRRIDAGLPDAEFVRVVREDPVREGLLYAGTEWGLHVSLDGGASWSPFQHGLPVVPVTDLLVKGDDLIAATQGRGFWILDDLGPVREWSADVGAFVHHLFRPAEAVRWRAAERFVSKPGANPPDGVVLHSWFREAPDPGSEPVLLQVLDASGAVVRTFTSADDARAHDWDSTREPHAPPAEPYGRFTPKAGLNALVWDLRRENVAAVRGHVIPFGWRGPRVPAGDYTVRLRVGAAVHEVPLRVVDDPREPASPEARAEVATTVAALYRAWDELHRAIERSRAVREQLADRVVRAKPTAVGEAAEAAAAPLADLLRAWEDGVIQARRETQQQMVQFENRLSLRLGALMEAIDRNGPPITAAARRERDELLEAWRVADAELRRVFAEDVPRANERLATIGLPGVFVPIEPPGQSPTDPR